MKKNSDGALHYKIMIGDITFLYDVQYINCKCHTLA